MVVTASRPAAAAAQRDSATVSRAPARASARDAPAMVRVRPDSISAVPGHDSTEVVPVARPDTAASAARRSGRLAVRESRVVLPTPTFDQPRWVMLRSLAVPGWGQFHNHAWIKGTLIAVADGSLRWKVLRDERRLSQLNRDATARLADLSAAAADTAAAGAQYRAAIASGDSVQIAAAQAALVAANARLGEASNTYNGVASIYNSLLSATTNRKWLLGGVILYALLDAYVDAHFRTFDIDFQVDPALPGGGKTPDMRLKLTWDF